MLVIVMKGFRVVSRGAEAMDVAPRPHGEHSQSSSVGLSQSNRPRLAWPTDCADAMLLQRD